MADFGECVKADFNLMPAITSGDSRIFQVIGAYEVQDNLITNILEAWPIPKGGRDGGPPPEPQDGGKGQTMASAHPNTTPCDTSPFATTLCCGWLWQPTRAARRT